MSSEGIVWCWRCVKREVKQVFDECFHCLEADRKREQRARDREFRRSERTHRDYRAQLEAADWQRADGLRNPRRNRKGAE